MRKRGRKKGREGGGERERIVLGTAAFCPSCVCPLSASLLPLVGCWETTGSVMKTPRRGPRLGLIREKCGHFHRPQKQLHLPFLRARRAPGHYLPWNSRSFYLRAGSLFFPGKSCWPPGQGGVPPGPAWCVPRSGSSEPLWTLLETLHCTSFETVLFTSWSRISLRCSSISAVIGRNVIPRQ